MAYGSVTLRTGIDEAMKVIFEDPIVNNVVQDSELLRFVEEDMNTPVTITTGGRYIEKSHWFRYGGAFGARTESGYVPRSAKPKFKNSRMYLRKLQGSVEMSGDVMARVKNDEGAFLNYMEEAMPKTVERITNGLDRQFLSPGFGVRARVTSIDIGASSIVVEDAMGVDGLTEAWKQFMEGDHIVFSDTLAGTTLRNNAGQRYAVVANIDEATNTLKLEDEDGNDADGTLLAAITIGDYIFEGDAAGASRYDTGTSQYPEITGFLAAVDDGGIASTYHNIARAENQKWQANVIDASDATLGFEGTLSEDCLVYSDEITAERGGGQGPTHIVVSRSGNRGYWKSLKGDRMFPDPRGAYEGGKAAETSRSGLPIVLGDRRVILKVARKMPPEIALMLRADSFKRYGLGEFRWNDSTGAVWRGLSDGTGILDQYIAFGSMYGELACNAPRKNCRIEGLIPSN